MFEKFLETPPAVWVTLGAVLAIVAVIFILARSKRRWSTSMLVTGAACLALAFVLSCVRLYRMPQGGSITPASMLPMFVFSYIFGMIPGLLVGLAYSILQMMQDFYFINPAQLMVDYILPFTALALCGTVRSAKIPSYWKIPLGVAIGSLVRVLFHVLSGAVFFAEYAGDMNPWIYSLGYNFSSVGIDGLICVVISLLPPVQKLIETMRRRLETPTRRARSTGIIGNR